ncbi:MAG: tRNA pseudouridine(55) synthase TruB [Firmicutes bacterium]|nr:tRNA pseudouridine(55) synthase TruB [Bacillota bacterium]
MDGIVNALKPPGMTSHDLVNWFRRHLGIKKVGHLGTLDPGAAGVLPICIGSATRLAEYMAEVDKEYRAEMLLGVETDSQDTSGRVVRVDDSAGPGEPDIRRALQGMRGRQMQTPPMVSAVKHQGKRLYQLAREGKTIEPPPREIIIHSLEVVKIECRQGFWRVIFDTRVSKGTYIRTICHQVGQRLGCGGALGFLVRTRVGPFDAASAWSLEEVEREIADGSYGFLLPSDIGISGWPAWILNQNGIDQVKHGGELDSRHLAQDQAVEEGQLIRLLDTAGSLVALGRIRKLEGKAACRPNKVFIQ